MVTCYENSSSGRVRKVPHAVGMSYYEYLSNHVLFRQTSVERSESDSPLTRVKPLSLSGIPSLMIIKYLPFALILIFLDTFDYNGF